MQQAWHIFKKDLLYLRVEIAQYLGSILVSGWLAAYNLLVTEILVALSGAYLIAMLIHADAPAGDRQFWITRPYRWSSLLGAKLLFILAIISLPVFLAQWIIVIHQAFPFAAVWRGLLWEQFLLFFGVYLPVAALAALTKGLVSFLSFILGALFIELAMFFDVYRPEHPLRSMEWVRSSLAFTILLVVSAIVVSFQYRKRRTNRNRMLAIGMLCCGAVVYGFVPWPLAFAIQKRLSTQPLDPSSLHIALDTSGEKWGLAMGKGKRVQVLMPLVVQGLPPGAEARPESLEITLRSAGGQDSRLNPLTFTVPNANNSSDLTLTGNGELDRGFFNAERDHPVILRGSLFLTVFGNKRAHTVYRRWPDKPVDVTSRLRCVFGPYGMMCDSPFRWPNEFIAVATGSSTRRPFYYPISYSPFPADLRFYPFEHHWATPPVSGAVRRGPIPDLTVEVSEPVAFLRRDFEIRDVRLADVAVPWRSRKISRDGQTFFENEY